MSIAYIGGGALVAATTGSQAIPLPAGVAEGHRLLMILASRNSSPVVWTYPFGWAEQAKIKNTFAAGVGTLAVATKLVGPSDTDPNMSIDLAGSGWGGAIAAFSGVDVPSGGNDVPAISGEADDQLTWDAPQITTVTGGSWVCSAVMVNEDGGIGLSIAHDFIERMGGASYLTSVGSDFSIALATREVATAGPVVSPQWGQLSLGPDRWNGVTLALRSAEGAPPPESPLSKLIDMDNRRFVRVVT